MRLVFKTPAFLTVFCATLLLFHSTHAEQKIIHSHAIAMHGDIKYPEDFQRFAYTSAEAKKGGDLRLYAFGSFDTFNAFIPKGQAASNIGLLYQTLLTASMDEPFTLYGLVATKLSYPENRQWISFDIHPKARFHDGKPITADDVIFSFNTLIEKGDPAYRFYYADVAEVLAESPQKVKFVFKHDKNKELALIVGQIPIFPKHYWKDKDFSKSSLDIPVGSGPYTIESFEPGRRVVFKRIKDHWSENLPVVRGRYNFDRIFQDYYQDENVALEAFKAGEYDVRRERVSRQWAASYTGPAIESGKIIKTEFDDHTPQGSQAFYLNLRREKFQNIAFRKALNYAFDFEWTNQSLFYGAYTRTKSYFTNSELQSEGLPEGRELEILTAFKGKIPSTVFTEIYKNPTTDGSGNNRKNLRSAKKLLREAGYRVVDNKLIDPKSKQAVEISYLLTDPAMERIVNPFARSLERLGITLKIEKVDSAQYINRIRKRDYDLFSTVLSQSLSPGNEQRDLWTSAAADLEGSRNYMGLKNPVVDSLVDQIITAPNRQELVYRTRALDRVLLHHHYMIPHWYSDSHRIAYWDTFAMPKTFPKYDPDFSGTIQTWWKKTAPQKTAGNN